jgi:hypothetical protein
MAISRLTAAAAGAASALIAERALRSGPARFARMSGSSIADPSAAGWITDFLNAAYYAKPRADRDLDDLRLAFTALTTRWHALGGRRLTALDVAAFHRCFFRHRWGTGESPRGTLTRRQLLDGGARLFGDWFPDAAIDPARRGWGIAFPTVSAKAAHDPEVRLRAARVGALTPPASDADDQIWHTYAPVEVASAEAALQALLAAESWPDYASELGRFTPLRRGGLADQTFEIEVFGFPTSRTPLFQRAYVTVTARMSADEPEALSRHVAEVNEGFARHGREEQQPVPDDAEAIAALDLTCHDGHFMGRALNRLFLFTHDGRAYLRAAGTWDEMDWHLAQVYVRAGRYAQHAFWGMESPEESMLHQIGRAIGSDGADGLDGSVTTDVHTMGS